MTATEKNILVALFMGYKKHHQDDSILIKETPNGNEIISDGALNYNSSWDWLMPCIGKISNECEEPEELDGLKYALLSNDIDTAFNFVVEYIN